MSWPLVLMGLALVLALAGCVVAYGTNSKVEIKLDRKIDVDLPEDLLNAPNPLPNEAGKIPASRVPKDRAAIRRRDPGEGG